MKTVDALLTKAGRSGVLSPAVKISIGDVVLYNNDQDGTQTCRNTSDGLEWSTKPGNRIMEVHTYEEPFGSSKKSKIVLNNNDNFLTDINFKGERCTICWGAYTNNGRVYDKQSPMYVKSQVFSEQQGTQVVTLTLLGLLDWLSQDMAQCDYIPSGTDTLIYLTVYVLEASIPPFTNCKKISYIIDNTNDSVFSVVIPGPSFKITKDRDSRATVLARLFDMTYVKMRAGSEDLIGGYDSVHFFIPSKFTNFEVSLDDTDHKYFVSNVYSEIFAPNDITVKNPNNEGTVYTGRAKDRASWDAIPSAKTEFVSGLASNAQANLVANAILTNLKSYYNGYSAKIPMLFGVELYDRVKLTSRRTGKSHEGNIGSIERVYNPRKGEPQYYMEIQTGRWFDPRAAWDVMGIGAGFVDTSEENKYLSVFVPARAYYAVLGFQPSEDTSFNYAAFSGYSNGDWAKYKVKLPTGSYKLRFGYFTQNQAGILKVYIDDVLALTVDQYNITTNFSAADETVTIAASTSDWHEFKFLIDGKWPGSGDYVCNYTDFVLYPI